MCLVVAGCTPEPLPQEATVATFNIRYDNPSDGEDAWPNRRDWVSSLIDSSGATIIGLQEALLGQITDITERTTRFAWVGAGRDDGATKGEYSPVLYDSLAWNVISWETRWLSPDSSAVGMAGWDAALPRIATLVDFERVTDSKPLRVINTHFDHRGEEARFKSAGLIARWAKEAHGDVIVMGDFNFQDSDLPYGQLVASGETNGLTDAATRFSARNIPTFRTFDATNAEGPRIDYVFVSESISLLSYEVLAPVRDGRFPSDHLPVVVTVSF